MKHPRVILSAIFFAISVLIAACSFNPPEFGLKAEVKGEGPITILFESGMAGTGDEWEVYTDTLSRYAKTFSYDRAGIGASDSAVMPRTIPNMVFELRSELDRQGLEPPYILVGHSMGSYLSRYFVHHYPTEVKAMVLIDPSPEKMYDDYTEVEMQDFIAFGDRTMRNSPSGDRAEWEQYLENRSYVRNIKVPLDIPITVYSATQWDFWEYHKGIVNNNPNSAHIQLEGTHALHEEQSELIINQIINYIQLLEK